MTVTKTVPVPIREWMETEGQWPLLAGYMLDGSGLPGPRANLELAESFAMSFARPSVTETSWAMLSSWALISDHEAAANDPREFLPFCAVQASCAHYGYADAVRRTLTEGLLKTAMNDSRWRLREAAAIGLQTIGEYDFSLLQGLLDSWKAEATLPEQRAFVAALAHPPLLKEQTNARYSLDLAGGIMEGILSSEPGQGDREHYRVLSKGLEYSLSLFVASEPEAGFAMLRRFAQSGDPRMLKIVKSNLGKARLSKKYPDQVADLLTALTMC
ncbi:MULTISPECIES: hypothetical protein [Paenibacillus]|uniref:HEAT repeat domain-containing protein n=1 Tax=Paenibacillus borealis TaxID=160799 RepID=A0ABX3H6S2_PAEBO|nr:hypothetical protein [Paenibacillus borealis]OMD45919.1 hypothetical protein BSK56_18305 [Paenibacillus borealis]